MIRVEHSGDFNRFEKFSDRVLRGDIYSALDSIAQQGVSALAASTPSRSGVTAASWDYTIEASRSGCSISWTNSNVNNGFPVAIGLQYGHGTGTGGWVSGTDYINPAIRPIFDALANHVWKAVTEA